MNEIQNLASKYFEQFESLALYPGVRAAAFWKALSGALVFLGGLTWYLRQSAAHGGRDSLSSFVVLVGADGALFWTALVVSRFHKTSALARANEGRGSNLQTVDAAKAATLCRYFQCRPSEFLSNAKQIQELDQLSANTRGSLLNEPSSYRRNWLNEASKSRIMSIFLSVLAVAVTLLAATAAQQEEFLQVLGDPGVWQFVATLEVFAVFLFSLFWGLRWLIRTGGDVAARWSMKISGSAWARRRKVEYLIRDLARLHRMPPRRAARISDSSLE